MQIQPNILHHLFREVYFITGTAYAGKSTAVRLLAERHGGICCGENYHDVLMDAIDPVHQPSLGYFSTMSGWQEFISRTPDEYEAWVNGNAAEITQLEVICLLRAVEAGRPVFVDTNIPLDTLREISDHRRVAVMLSPQSMSVERFFDRPDPDKQFLLRQIEQAPDPDATMRNFCACIARVNSPERYRAYAESGFFTYTRTEQSTIEEALAALETHFGLR